MQVIYYVLIAQHELNMNLIWKNTNNDQFINTFLIFSDSSKRKYREAGKIRKEKSLLEKALVKYNELSQTAPELEELTLENALGAIYPWVDIAGKSLFNILFYP